MRRIIASIFLVSALFVNTNYSSGQALEITSSGETGTSGTNWSLTESGNLVTITNSGTATINTSVIENALNQGKDVLVANSGAGAFGISIQNTIEKTSGSSNRLTFKSNGIVTVSSNVTIESTSGAMDIILWADADNSQNASNFTTSDEIEISPGVSLQSNGGLIVLAGGLDDGANGGTANDGIPDNYAYRGTGNSLGGVNLGPSGGTGTVISLLSNGGDIIIRGRSRASTTNPRPGIVSQANLRINAGSGRIDMQGISSVSNGIEFAFGATPNIAITSSYSGSGPAIRLAGATENSGIGIFLVNNSAGNFLIQSTSNEGGGVLFQAHNGTSNGNTAVLFLPDGSNTNLQILSRSGDIVVENAQVFSSFGPSQGVIRNLGTIRYGAHANTTPVQGITPDVPSSNANVVFRGKDIQFETGSPITNIVSTGKFILEPLAADNSFTSAITFRNVDLGTTLNEVRIGKATNTANITLSPAITANGTISVYGGSITLSNNLTTTNNGDISLFTDNAIGGLSATRNISASGSFNYIPRSTSFVSAVSYPISNLSVTSGGLTLGKEGNTANITFGSAVSTSGPISVFGGLIDINGNLQSTATSGNGISLTGTRILHRANRSVLTSGADIDYSATNLVPTSAVDNAITLDGTSGNVATINADGGNINLTATFATGGVAGGSDRALGAAFANIITSGNGTITIVGDATNNLNSGSTAWGTQLGSTTIQSENGDITLDFTGGKATSNSRGLAVDNSSLSILSASGTITVIDREPVGLTGTHTALYLRPNAANTIIFGADGSNVASSTSDIILQSNRITFDANPSSFNTSGEVSLTPDGAIFTNTLNTTLANVSSSASGFTLGKEGNTSDITIGRTQSIAGPISVYGGSITAAENMATSVANGTILLKGSANINISASKQITTNNSPIILWADSDNSQSTTNQVSHEINISEGVSLESNGGLIVLAGGLDDGANGGTADDGIPDNYAHRGSGNSLGGVNLGPPSGTGAAISLSSNGGDIIIRGRSRASVTNPRPGIVSQANLKIDAGSGRIDMQGISSVSNGIEFAFGATPNIAITSSYSGSGPAIRLAGATVNSHLSIFLVNNSGGNFLIQSTSTTGGGVLFQAHNGTSNGNTAILFLPDGSNTNLQILSGSGDIVVENAQVDASFGSSQGIIRNVGNIRYGTHANTTTVQGIAPDVPSSNANVIFRGKDIQFETGSPITNIVSTGKFILEPLAADNSFTSAITFRNVNLGTTLNEVRIGKADNTADITLGSALSVAGPISVYGGNINVAENLGSTVANGTILLKGSADINISTSKQITTSNAPVILWANSDGGTTNGAILLGSGSGISTGGGHLWMGGGSGTTTWNGLTVGNGAAVPGTSITVPVNSTQLIAGILLNACSIETDGGNIELSGNVPINTGSGTFILAGIISYGTTTLDAGSGIVNINVETALGASQARGMLTGPFHSGSNPSTFTVKSSSSANPAISITVNKLDNSSFHSLLAEGNTSFVSSGQGGIQVNATAAGTGNGIRIPAGAFDILSASGAININSGVTGISFGSSTGLTIGSKLNTDVATSSSNIFLKSNNVGFQSSTNINTTGTLNIIPLDNSVFTGHITYPITNLNATHNGLVIGNATNDKNITITAPITGTGSVGLFGNVLSLNDNITCSTLDLKGTATLAAGKFIDASGNFTHNGPVTLAAISVSNYAQLKFGGTYSGSNGSVTQQQHLNAGWVMVGASMNNTNAGFFGDVGSTGPGHTGLTQNLFSWDGEDYVNLTNNSTTITPGMGYFGFVGPFGFRGAVGVHDFTGAPNTSTTPSLVNTTAASGIAIEGTHTNERDGWNLIANPFTCGLDFSGLSLTDVGNAFYIYNNNKSGGAGYDFWSLGGITDPYIAPMQAFWVKASGGSPSLGTLSMATHGTTSHTPAHLRTQPFDRLVLRAHASADTANNDYTVVSFIEDNTTMGYDGAWDAIKMANAGTNIYSTHTNGDVMAVNAIPYGPNHSEKRTVPISFKAAQHGQSFTIRFDDTYMINSYAVYLEDKLMQTFTDLTANDYSFINDTNMVGRFVLHFQAGALSIEAPGNANIGNGITTWVFNHQAYLNPQFTGNAMLTLFDISGKKLQAERIEVTKGQLTEWPMRADVAAGVYLLRVETEAGMETIKFTK